MTCVDNVITPGIMGVTSGHVRSNTRISQSMADLNDSSTFDHKNLAFSHYQGGARLKTS